jgi:hypothetical protein
MSPVPGLNAIFPTRRLTAALEALRLDGNALVGEAERAAAELALQSIVEVLNPSILWSEDTVLAADEAAVSPAPAPSSSSSSSSPPPPPGQWTLVARQTAPHYFEENEWAKNSGDPSNDNYAILDQLEQHRGCDGGFQFKLVWPSSPATSDQQWKQTSNPVTAEPTDGVEGYESDCMPIVVERVGWARPWQ